MEQAIKVGEPSGAASELSDVLCVTTEELIDLLEYVFEKYENGQQCYEDPDDCSGYLGHAIHLGDTEFQRIADILNAHRPVHNKEVTGRPPHEPEQE